MAHFTKRQNPVGAWVRQMLTRAHPNVVVVALAAKLARIAWAVLRHGRVRRDNQGENGATMKMRKASVRLSGRGA